MAAALLLVGLTAVGKSAGSRPYVNRTLGFQISYPANYRNKNLPCDLARFLAVRGSQSLLYVSSGVGRNEGNISVVVDKRPFSMKALQLDYAHTGWEAPDQIEVGKFKFYYYGAGGGGVTYPDDYFYDLNGQVLLIRFDGPYPPNHKTPSDETKQMEKTVLGSFRTFQSAK